MKSRYDDLTEFCGKFTENFKILRIFSELSENVETFLDKFCVKFIVIKKKIEVQFRKFEESVTNFW